MADPSNRNGWPDRRSVYLSLTSLTGRLRGELFSSLGATPGYRPAPAHPTAHLTSLFPFKYPPSRPETIVIRGPPVHVHMRLVIVSSV